MDCDYCKKQSAIYNHSCLGCLARHVLIFPKHQRRQVMQDFSRKWRVELTQLQQAVTQLYQLARKGKQ